MGMELGEWSFTHSPPLTLESIADSLGSGMELEVLVLDDHSINVLLFKERLIRWKFGENAVSVCTIAPANPFVWAHLDYVMRQHGGSLPDPNDPDTIVWQPHPRAKALLRSWNELSWQQQFVLKHPITLALAGGIFEGWLYPIGKSQ